MNELDKDNLEAIKAQARIGRDPISEHQIDHAYRIGRSTKYDELEPFIGKLIEERDEAVNALREMVKHSGGPIEDNGLDNWDPNYRWWIEDTPWVAKAKEVLANYEPLEFTHE